MESQDEKCDYSVPSIKSLGHYCIENKRCKEIIHFLTLCGKHNVGANVEMLYQDALITHGNVYVETFAKMVDEVLYPIFVKRFRLKNLFMENNTFISVFGAEKIDDTPSYKLKEMIKRTGNGWLKDSPDYATAITIFDDAMNRLYRVLSVLNHGNDSWSYGTLVANVISELDPNAKESTHEKKAIIVAFSRLQKDLENLLHQIVPVNNLSLTSFFELLGYDDNFLMSIESNSTTSNTDSTGQCLAENSEDVETQHGLGKEESYNLESNFESKACSFESLKQKWNKLDLNHLYQKATNDDDIDEGMTQIHLKNFINILVN